MKIKQLLFFGFIISLVFTSCSPTVFVKPLEEKQHAITASFGGPVARVPNIAPIPVPLTSLGYGYGLKKNITIFGNIHTTSALFGTFQTQIGGCFQPWFNERNNQGFSVNPSFHFMIDVFEKKPSFYPQLDANYYWNFKKKNSTKPRSNYFYAGISNFIELRQTKAHDLEQKKNWKLIPQLGTVFERKQFSFSLETKFIAPFTSNEKITVSYVSYHKRFGAMGIYFGLTYRFKTHEKK